jgi:hypothetical protein
LEDESRAWRLLVLEGQNASSRLEGFKMTVKAGKDLHSALKTEQVSSIRVQGLQLVLRRLQWAKDDVAFSLHISPTTFSTSGLQLTDALSYVGFQRQRCPFMDAQDGYCDWANGGIDLSHFADGVTQVHESLSNAERHFNACGLRLPQPEGFGYFLGKQSSRRPAGAGASGDGHTSPSIEVMKTSEDRLVVESLMFATPLSPRLILRP